MLHPRFKIATSIGFVFIFTSLIGCESMQSVSNSVSNISMFGEKAAETRSSEKDIEDAQEKDRKAGTGTGAVIGGTIGAVVGKQLADDSPLVSNQEGIAAGAYVGGILGGALGAGAGDAVADERADYAERLATIDSQIAESDKRIALLRSGLLQYEAEATRLTERIKQTERDIKEEQNRAERLKAERAWVEAQIKEVQEDQKFVNEEIERLRKQIAHADKLLADYPDKEDVKRRHDTLKKQEVKLQGDLKRYFTVGKQFVKYRDRLPESE